MVFQQIVLSGEILKFSQDASQNWDLSRGYLKLVRKQTQSIEKEKKVFKSMDSKRFRAYWIPCFRLKYKPSCDVEIQINSELDSKKMVSFC